MSRLFSKSKRQNIVYFVLFSAIVSNVFFISYGLTHHIDLMGLAACLTAFDGSLIIPTFAYLWGETKRPHGRS